MILLANGEPRTKLLGLGGRLGVQLTSDCSVEGDDPLAFCRELNKGSDVNEKVLQKGLDWLSTARQKLAVSHAWMAW